MKRYKRGDKHPTEDLIFWQYHNKDYKKTNNELWVTLEKFKEKFQNSYLSTKKVTKNEPLKIIVHSAISRDKYRFNTSKDELINYDFIKDLLIKQNNRCYWYNIEMNLNILESSRNPLKLTIDRLDNSKGYSKDNVVLSSYAANCGKGNINIKDWEKVLLLIKEGLNKKINNLNEI